MRGGSGELGDTVSKADVWLSFEGPGVASRARASRVVLWMLPWSMKKNTMWQWRTGRRGGGVVLGAIFVAFIVKN